MKSYFLILYFLLVGVSSFCQTDKPVLDTSILEKWPYAGIPVLNNAGNYGYYSVVNKPKGNKTLVVRSIRENWEMEFIGIQAASFTNDGKKLVFLNSSDSLCLLTLGTSFIEYIPGVKSFHLFQQQKNDILLYSLSSISTTLVMQNLNTTTYKQSYNGVINYVLSNDGSMLVLLRKSDNSRQQFLDLVSVVDYTKKTFWQGENASDIMFDETASQLAFITQQNDTSKVIWIYRLGDDSPVMLINNSTNGINGNFIIDKIASEGFTKDGMRLFFVVKERAYSKASIDGVMVDIWNYKDSKLQSKQLSEIEGGGGDKNYLAVIKIADKTVQRVQMENDVDVFAFKNVNDYVVVNNRAGSSDESSWNPRAKNCYFLVSLKDGTRKQIRLPEVSGSFLGVSPSGKYLAIQGSQNIFTFDLKSGILCNTTKNLPIPFINGLYDYPTEKLWRNIKIASWLENDEGILVYGYNDYDIWLISPNGLTTPINITNGYGRRHQIIFRLTRNYYDKVIANGETVLLCAFDKLNKNNGFYRKIISAEGDPELLTMGGYLYCDEYRGNPPININNGRLFLVQRMRADQSPNWFTTTDFKTFFPFSNVYPEINYNWLTAELHTWKSLDSHILQGILYKPENFNPKRKYPIIFYYYEKLSDKLYEYEKPGLSEGWLNIPWFVSHGYLVFTPDISYSKGEPGKSAYNAVVSAAKYLMKYSWVDHNKMAIQGHSWGAYETNFIVTKTTLFKAAMSASGPTDFVSGYNSIGLNGISLQFFYEVYQSRIGSTLWQRPDLFIRNSPIFEANKVETPLLMMNNKEDRVVPFSQGVEFFIALRRLSKKVWMLQYDDEAHSLNNQQTAMDFTIRVTQFFDHYLKNNPAPSWMTNGILASQKGVECGYKLDPAGQCGLDCKICEEWNKKSMANLPNK